MEGTRTPRVSEHCPRAAGLYFFTESRKTRKSTRGNEKELTCRMRHLRDSGGRQNTLCNRQKELPQSFSGMVIFNHSSLVKGGALICLMMLFFPKKEKNLLTYSLLSTKTKTFFIPI